MCLSARCYIQLSKPVEVRCRSGVTLVEHYILSFIYAFFLQASSFGYVG